MFLHRCFSTVRVTIKTRCFVSSYYYIIRRMLHIAHLDQNTINSKSKLFSQSFIQIRNIKLHEPTKHIYQYLHYSQIDSN